VLSPPDDRQGPPGGDVGEASQETQNAMGEFIPVARIADLSPGQMKWLAVNGERVLLANVDGMFYALRDVCGHQRAPLSRGKLEGHVVECPRHFAQFDVRTGKLVDGPRSADVPVFEVRIDGDVVYVKPQAS
jgi:3-phenylpropionate/trans-cinnamate dioxygenase ferredoxin subunit